MEIGNINTTTLAFMGDAVYEEYVRKKVILSGEVHSDVLHKKAVKYVKAKAQSYVLKEMMKDFLTEEEISLCKRARNHKMRTMAKNQDPVDYKNATALEALIGYLYLMGDINRLEEIIARAFNIMEEKNE